MADEVPQFDAATHEFMMLEFESQRDMRASLNTLVASEINIYVAIVGATFLALAFIGQVLHSENDKSNDNLVLGIAFGALVAVLLLGCAMYHRVVSSRITVVKYARNMNRVRYYFVEKNDALRQYVSSDIYDNKPPYGSVGSAAPVFGSLVGNTGLISILNSSSVAAMVGIGYSMLGISTDPFFSIRELGISWGLFALVSSFAFSIALHHAYQKHKYAREERKSNSDSYHPSPK